jgi:DNA-binding Lrp family transcriptional regulator
VVTTVSRLPASTTREWRGFRLDELDRRIIVALQANGRASWKKIAYALGASEPTVARRGRRIVDAGLVRVVGYIDVARVGLGMPAMVRITCDPRERERLGQVIQQRSDVRVAALVTGAADIVAEFVVATPADLVKVLNEDLPNIHGIQNTETFPVMHSFYSVTPWEPDLLTGEEMTRLTSDEVAPTATRQWEAPVAVDAVDLAILAELAEDGRRTAKAIASSIGNVSESTVARRIERLVSEGCVYFRVIAPPAMLGLNVEVLTWLRVDSGHLDEAARKLLQHSSVKYLWVTAGRFNLCVSAHLRHLGALYSLETEVLGDLPLTGSVEVATHLTTVKRAWLPLDAYNVPGDAAQASNSVRELIQAADRNS